MSLKSVELGRDKHVGGPRAQGLAIWPARRDDSALQGSAASSKPGVDRGRGATRSQDRARHEAGFRFISRLHIQQSRPLCGVHARGHAANLSVGAAGFN